MNYCLRKKKTGVSPIIGALILLASAMLFTSILLVWSLGLQGQSQVNVGSALGKSNQQANEFFLIEEVLFDTTANSVRIYIRNAAGTPVQIKSLFFINAMGALLHNSELSPGQVVTSRSTVAINVVLPQSVNLLSLVGSTVTIRVGSLNGNQVESNFRVQ